MATTKSEQYQVNLFVPDLHSFTTPVDHSKLKVQIMHNLRLFVAAGLPLDKPDIHIYRQSYIPAHSEMTWILDCFTRMGELGKMTQFKEKSFGLSNKALQDAGALEVIENEPGKASEAVIDVTVGLFNYPVLMASDILLYGATYVPVGDDQSQHLEFTRDIAERLNNKFERDLFVVPKAVKEQHQFFGKDQGLRIKDLQEPTKKMSKSDELGKGVIYLCDLPDEAAKKVMSATTDSVGVINLDWENQPGISNLLQILALFTNQPLDAVASEWQGKTSYGDLKTAVAEATKGFLEGLQAKMALVDDDLIYSKLASSEEVMNQIAGKTLENVQKAVGLR